MTFSRRVTVVAFLLLLVLEKSASQTGFFSTDVSSKWWKKHFGSEVDPSTCPTVERIGNGSVEIVGGNKASYSCNPSFTLVGQAQIQCACGEWIGTAPSCRKDGEWGSWTSYSSCSRTCGVGLQTRQRFCDNPRPERNGKPCPGSPSESRECTLAPCSNCPVKGTILLGALNITSSNDGQKLFVSCAEGFRLSDPALALLDCRFLNTTDVNALCVQTCRSPTNPLNGTVIHDDGLTAQFQCDLGFVLQGSQTLLCDNGQWIGTEPQCDLVEETVEVPLFPAFADILGSDPSIVVQQNSYVQSQAFFAPICSTVLSFNYRMSRTVETVQIEADMVESNIDSTIRNDSVVIARSSATIVGDGTIDSKFFCLEVNQSCVNDSVLPTAAVVRTLVRFVSPSSSNTILEISSLSANEAFNCSEAARLNDEENNADDSEDNNNNRRRRRNVVDDYDYDYDYDYDEDDEDDSTDCDNSTASGDCGFTNDPCGAASFAVNLVDDDDDDDEGTSIVSLQTKKPTESDACSVDVCIPCLADTGVSVSNAVGSVANVRLRGKRRASNYQFFSVRKRFCVDFRRDSRYAIANSPKRPRRRFSRYMSFGYSLGAGTHGLTVQVVCFGGRRNRERSIIQLGNGNDFKKQFRNNDPRRGKMCLKLRLQKRKCNLFQITFTANGNTKVCVNSFTFMKSEKHRFFSFHCGTIHNKL